MDFSNISDEEIEQAIIGLKVVMQMKSEEITELKKRLAIKDKIIDNQIETIMYFNGHECPRGFCKYITAACHLCPVNNRSVQKIKKCWLEYYTEKVQGE